MSLKLQVGALKLRGLDLDQTPDVLELRQTFDWIFIHYSAEPCTVL
jgi:hypothetical protein